MGNIISFGFLKKGEINIETHDGWEQRMQELISNITQTEKKLKQQQRLYSRIKWYVLFGILVCICIGYYSVDEKLNVDYKVARYLAVPILFIVFILMFMLRIIRKTTSVLNKLKEEEVQHKQAVTNVKACLADINQLIIKYNIKTQQITYPEIKNIIKQLVELPLCPECRLFTNEDREKILSQIPRAYSSMFMHLKPQNLNQIKKPFDEQLMSFLDSKENTTCPTNDVKLIKSEESSCTKNNVLVEEIMEEENEKEENNEVRKRNIKSVDLCFC